MCIFCRSLGIPRSRGFCVYFLLLSFEHPVCVQVVSTPFCYCRHGCWAVAGSFTKCCFLMFSWLRGITWIYCLLLQDIHHFSQKNALSLQFEPVLLSTSTTNFTKIASFTCKGTQSGPGVLPRSAAARGSLIPCSSYGRGSFQKLSRFCSCKPKPLVWSKTAGSAACVLPCL